MTKINVFIAIVLVFTALLTSCFNGPTPCVTTTVISPHEKHTVLYRFDSTDHWCEYVCDCLIPNLIEKHIDKNEDGLCDVCSYVYYSEEYDHKFSDHYSWILDITSDDIAEIQMRHHIMNSELGTYDNVFSLYDKNNIDDFINQLKSLTMYMIAGFEPAPNASKLFYDIKLNDGTVYSFNIHCGFLDSQWSLKYQPSILKYSNTEMAYSFVLYLTFGQVYEYNIPSKQICCLNNIDDFEFELINTDDAPKSVPTHFIKINHTTLYVLNSNTFYYFNENDEKILCRLTNGDLYQMFDEFSVNYQLLVNAFLDQNPNLTSATVNKYFGTAENGAIMGLITSPEIEYTESPVTEWIDGTPIKDYFNVYVLYQNELYSVGTAFKNGIITKNDVKTIYLMQ